MLSECWPASAYGRSRRLMLKLSVIEENVFTDLIYSDNFCGLGDFSFVEITELQKKRNTNKNITRNTNRERFQRSVLTRNTNRERKLLLSSALKRKTNRESF